MSEKPGKLETTFVFEKDTKRTRRFAEETDRPPIIGTLYVQQWALRQLTGGNLPHRIRVILRAGDPSADIPGTVRRAKRGRCRRRSL